MTNSSEGKIAFDIVSFLKRKCSLVSWLQFLVCLFFWLMLWVTMIALNDLIFRDSPIRRFLISNLHIVDDDEYVQARPIKYPRDEQTEALLGHPDHCREVRLFDALVLVHSATFHFERRNEYRMTYGNFEFTKPYKLKVVFFLGIPEDSRQQESITTEHKHHMDTVQGNFVDTYKNLTYKAVMSFRWASMHCKEAKLILKMDDDVILDVHRFFEEFPYPPQYQQELIFCHMWMFAEVERTGKWGISLLEYGQDYYPPYCSGFFVVIMPAIVEDIYQAAKATPFLWLDDVFIYGVVREEMQFVQIVNLDEVAYRQEHYRDCYKAYGYRCKYYVTVLGKSKTFAQELLTLRADRLRTLYSSDATLTCPAILFDPFLNSAPGVAVQIPISKTQLGLPQNRYIEEYTCTNRLATEKQLKDIYMSFPSGHMAVATYSAIYIVLYLELRMSATVSYFLRPAVQSIVLLLCLLCGVTRITDHKHYPSDVIFGALLGGLVACAVFYRIAWNVIPNPLPENTASSVISMATAQAMGATVKFSSQPVDPSLIVIKENLSQLTGSSFGIDSNKVTTKM
ncbi:beta-1 3-galactosyltransferase 1 [Biomphalaria pfeifferi]|uniref:Beta-1 3-galactosyltransferase 1 n=1 Tax=Biomphalaria pfeifferi TaxID=112525 RepID=A0AAD8F9A8_BIOPF|nr:beta-1 3-galactosyltransferase 1 [Biomphalaria pfeifferi]